ncbi:MAG: HAMP domain-containing sensor histidine kinase [Burkholderiales bacterium]|nr:HAMP domain-containing sensor histidine kinase [Burkholderiales bacterium]
MWRSFRLKFFITTTLLIVLFAIITRVNVRTSSSQPIHELLYSNFASFLQLTIKAEEVKVQNDKTTLTSVVTNEYAQRVQRDIEKYFADLSDFNAWVWFSDSASEQQIQMMQGLQWRKLQIASEHETLELAKTNASGLDWVLFKVSFQDQYVVTAVNANAFQMRFSAIMDARDSILNSMWPVLLLYIALCTWILTEWVLRSLRNLQLKFQDIELQSSKAVLSEKDFDREFESFVGYFNDLIKRLRFNFEQASRFSSDAAHELRTPLTVIRGNLKRLLNRAPDNSVEQIQLSMLSDEVERLISITNKLVLLSQADGRNFKLDMQEIKLIDVIGILSEDIQSLVPDIQFKLNVSPHIKILADHNLFQQLLNNLMSNAVKYTSPDGTIVFEAKVIDNMVEFSLANTTYLSLDGLDDRVFQRFYRHLDEADSSRQLPRGDGLGLSLCQEIAKAHGSFLTLEKGPDNWVKFKSHWKMA